VDINEVLTRGVEQIFPSKESLHRLMLRKKISLYQGFDPSMPSLHLGNLVGLMKLRQFQKLGHKIIFLVGDFTGMIGDPTDRFAPRKQLTREEVLRNTESWKTQVAKILDFKGPNPAKFLFNSTWLDNVGFKELIGIAANFTVQQMIERDMFQKRLKDNKPIYLHEFLYPIAQGLDSVIMDVDLEIGGSDQIFNMLAGRSLMKAMKNKEKYVLATKLLIDKEGKKVGKTEGNALFLNSTPSNFYAGIMALADEVIPLSFELFTELPLRGIEEKVRKNPIKEKKRLAFEIVNLLWGGQAAETAQREFEKTFQERNPDYPIEMPIGKNLAETIAPFTTLGSLSEAKRIIQQGGVDVDGEKITNPNFQVVPGSKIKVGKKIFGTAV